MNKETKNQECQTDEQLSYNYAWSKYYQHFVNFYLSSKSSDQNDFKSVDKNETEIEEKLDAESIKKIANSVMENKGFLYDPNSNLYYDTQNALYYDQDKKLYFDIENGINYHYLFNKQTNTYHLRYHSKISKQEILRLKKTIGLSTEIEEQNLKETDESSQSDQEDISTSKFPPCIRAILIESNLDEDDYDETTNKYELGSLFIIPYTGGLIGSDPLSKENYVINLPDVYQIDRIHASIRWKKKGYFIKDITSSTGTFINGKKLEPNKDSEILHGDKLGLGETLTLLIHIHEGSNTCLNCEPGEVMHRFKQEKEKTKKNLNEKSKEDLRRENVKLIKSKYGLKKSDNVKMTITCSDYTDRAKQRRDQLGVDYSHIENVNVPTTKSSIDNDKSSIGLKLMSKMGWQEGKGLGKKESGIIEPISTKLKLDKAGIGSETTGETSIQTTESEKRKILNWKKTKERFESIKPLPTDSKLSSVFNEEDEEI